MKVFGAMMFEAKQRRWDLRHAIIVVRRTVVVWHLVVDVAGESRIAVSGFAIGVDGELMALTRKR